MKERQMDESSRLLGHLESSVDGLKEMLVQQNKESRDSRQKVYEKLEEVVLRAQATDSRVTGLEERLAKIEPHVLEIGKWRERAIGAKMTISLFWVTVGGVVTSGILWLWNDGPWKSP